MLFYILQGINLKYLTIFLVGKKINEYSRDFILLSRFNTHRGIRIPVTSVKGKCPRPLDDGGK